MANPWSSVQRANWFVAYVLFGAEYTKLYRQAMWDVAWNAWSHADHLRKLAREQEGHADVSYSLIFGLDVKATEWDRRGFESAKLAMGV